MTDTPDSRALPDALERRRAVETFDRNLVVTAGAGTGKTTLLVDRVVHLLLRNPDPLKVTDIIALTFTNKAAAEMKQRLRERLLDYLAVDLKTEPFDNTRKKRRQEVETLRRLYLLSKTELDGRVEEALRHIERADIGTIHSFASTLLRRYPLEAGVDPQFREDDGREFDRIFDEQWDLWLAGELSLESAHADQWRTVLKSLGLEPIRALANSLCAETVELSRPGGSGAPGAALLRAWLEELIRIGSGLLERHPAEGSSPKLIRSAVALIRDHLEAGAIAPARLVDEKQYLLTRSVGRKLRDWPDDDIRQAQNLVRIAKKLCQVDDILTTTVRGLLVGYVEQFRESFVREGFVSFDGLLVRARNLVRDHLPIREELKEKYRAILIDEFQDTDPIQYEILLYLGERPASSAGDWRKISLTPGKIFVVGDPKQSIYAFRRADIDAYLEVVDKIITAQNGVECRLTSNFRSNGEILDAVNGIFASLMQAQPGAQPPYVPIETARRPEFPERPAAGCHVLPKVLVRKIRAPQPEVKAEQARRLEGESLAAWLRDEVLEKALIVNADGERVPTQAKDVAILFRKLTDIHDYLEPLRRRGIRYVVEGERHFYAVKEIIDTVNLLRAIENPHDRIALVGVLRSPLGGLTDQEIYDLRRRDMLDYRRAEKVVGADGPPALAELYRSLDALHRECPRLPVGDAVSRVFAALPLKPLAACASHGEQAVANIEKLRQQAELLGSEASAITFSQAIRRLEQRVLDVKEEGESVLAEENIDAVRIMSIHKAKGLEFPLVILAGCQTGAGGRQSETAEALFDWSSSLAGIRVGPVTDLAGLFISEKSRLRAEQEQVRVLYVAMTRAREHIVLSSGPSRKRSSGSFVSLLEPLLDHPLDEDQKSATSRIGAGKLDIHVVDAALTAPRPADQKRMPRARHSWQDYVELWGKRRRAWETVMSTPAFITPTSLKSEEWKPPETAELLERRPIRRAPALVVGDLAHRFLADWDFRGGKEAALEQLDNLVAKWLPPELEPDAVHIHAELNELLGRFLESEAYRVLSGARVLGREVPLLIPWDGRIMEGVIDVIYECKGLLYLADYKTDKVEAAGARLAAERYRRQAEIYATAARFGLKREVAAFHVIFLRLGKAVELDVKPQRELWLF